MAEQSKPNTFTGGMKTDLDPSYQPKDSYFTGLNIRVVTNGDNSYSLENIQGPKKEWDLNVYSDGVYYSGTSRYVIHGAIVVDDYIITIEGKKTASNKNWKIRKYAVNHLGDLSLDGSTDTQLWSGAGLFSDNAGEIEMEVAVETETIHRVYCTDGITSLKSINVKEVITNNDVTDFTAFKPDVSIEAELSNYDDKGGQLSFGSYSYVYRLASKNQSNWSDWSPISTPVNVIKGSLSNQDSLTLLGETSAETSASKITVNITDIPTEYEIIQVAAIHYVSNLASTVSIVEDGDLNGTTYSFVHSGFETEVAISGGVAGVLISNLTWDSCKTLAQKDNKLYAGNLTSSLMDLDLSSYRVKSYKWTDSGSAWVPEAHTEIHNPHRHYNGSGGNSSYSVSNDATDKSIYKFINNNYGNYASPVLVLGAETPGYSAGGYGFRITFSQEEYTIDNKWGDVVEGVQETGLSNQSGAGGVDYGVNFKSRPYKVDNTENDANWLGGKPGPSNPKWDSTYRGFKRGECYRFGIVCFDLKGVPGFVHHLGDIKMPDTMDPNHRTLAPYGDSSIPYSNSLITGSTTWGAQNQLGKSWIPVISAGARSSNTIGAALIPRIEVRLPSSITDTISGYKIVRVEMNDDDRIIITQGLLNSVVTYEDSSNTNAEMRNKTGVGYTPHLLRKSDNNGTNSTGYGGNIAQHGYTLDTPDCTLGAKNISYGQGFDLKILYPVEMDMAKALYYQDNMLSSLPAQQQNITGTGKQAIWSYNNQYTQTAVANTARLLQYVSANKFGTQFYEGVTPTTGLGGGLILDFNGCYHSYKYRPPGVWEELSKHRSTNNEILLNGVTRPIKYSKTITQLEEVSTSDSGMSKTFRNAAAHNQSRTFYDALYANAGMLHSGGVEDAGHRLPGATTIFISVEPENLPLPCAIKVDNAESDYIPDEHWFGHCNDIVSSSGKSYMFNSSKWICEIIRDTSAGFEQFGGTSDGSIRQNRFISSSKFIKKDTTNFLITGGDVFVDYYTQGKTMQTGVTSVGAYGQSFVTESFVNPSLRSGVFLGSSDAVSFNVEDNYTYNTAYIQSNNLKGYVAKPNDFSSNDYFKSKVAASSVKLTGEPFDAWSVFPANDFIELNLSEGKITDLVNYRNQIYTIQDSGVALLSINPRTLITGEGAGADIQVVSGTGTAIERYDYLTTQYGSQHYNKTSVTPTGAYFLDVENNELLKLSEKEINPVSLTNSYKGYISGITKNQNIPSSENGNIGSLTKGIFSGYDNEFRESHFTIVNNSNEKNSFVISDLDGKLVSKLELLSDHTTTVVGTIFFKKYVSYKNRLFGVSHETTTNDNDQIYLLNSGVYQHFDVGVVINDSPTINKIFDTSEIISNVTNTTDTFTSHTLSDSTGSDAIAGSNERIREGIHRVSLRGAATSRARGSWLKHTIAYSQVLSSTSIDASVDKKFNIFAVNTRFRQSR